MKIEFDVTYQNIERTDRNHVVADSKNYLQAEFNFQTAEWVGKTKTAVFARLGLIKNVILESDDTCMVPWEMLKTGSFTVSVFAGDLITANYVKVPVAESGYQLGETPQPPTPDVYAQIIEMIENLQAGEVSEEQIKKAVDEYLTENPVEGLSEEDVQNIISEYLTENPTGVDEEEVKKIIDEYLAENPVEGLTQEDVEKIIGEYLIENPVAGLTDEQIAAAIDEYLAENPIEGDNPSTESVENDSILMTTAKADGLSQEWYDLYKYPPIPTWGHEYLYSWYEKLYNGESVVICAEGDSTTYEGFWNEGGERRTMFSKIMDLGNYADYSIENCGYGSATSGHWVGAWSEDSLNELKNPSCTETLYPNGTLDSDMAKNPDLLIWSFGINDPSTNLYPDDTIEQKLTRFKNNLLEGLQRIRGNVAVNGRQAYNKTADELAIILCVPVTTYTPSLGKTRDLWTKYTRRVIQEACREYQCAFWDISMRHYDHEFSIKWSISTSGTGYDGTHPRPACNADFVSSVQDLLFPVCLWKQNTANNDSETTVDKTSLKSAISSANTNLASVSISEDGSDAGTSTYWVTQSVYDEYESAITVAQAEYDSADSTDETVSSAVSTLADATTIFNNAKAYGTNEDASDSITVTELATTGKSFNNTSYEEQDSSYSNGLTDYIPIEVGDTLTISALYIGNTTNATVVFYDTDKNVLSAIKCAIYSLGSKVLNSGVSVDATNKYAYDYSYTVPDDILTEGCAYVRVCDWTSVDHDTYPFYAKVDYA